MGASAAMIGLTPEAKEIEQRYRHTMEVPVTVRGRAAPGLLRHVFGEVATGPLPHRTIDVRGGMLRSLGYGGKRKLSYRERQRRGRKAAGRE